MTGREPPLVYPISDRWVAHTLEQITISAPDSLPLIVIGHGSWELVLRRPGSGGLSDVIVTYKIIKNETTQDAALEEYKKGLQRTRAVIGDGPRDKSFSFALPSGFRNKGKSTLVNDDSDITHSSYGFGIVLGDRLLCSVLLGKSHSPVSLADWRCENVFSQEERDLTKRIAISARLTYQAHN